MRVNKSTRARALCMELGSQQECPFGIFLCVFCLTKKGSVCALIVKRVFVIIEWLVGEKENI